MEGIMNISGVTQTAQVIPSTQPYQSAQSQQATQMDQPEAAMGADAVNFSAQVSTQVMDMATSQFENAANELISSMAMATGIGQTVDVSV